MILIYCTASLKINHIATFAKLNQPITIETLVAVSARANVNANTRKIRYGWTIQSVHVPAKTRRKPTAKATSISTIRDVNVCVRNSIACLGTDGIDMPVNALRRTAAKTIQNDRLHVENTEIKSADYC